MTTPETENRAVVFDIDGTLANNDHRVIHLYPDGVRVPKSTGKKNWDQFFAEQHLDTLHEDVASLAYSYWCNNINVFLLTGRGEEHRKVTEEWLHHYSIPYDEMVMRPEGDRTEDTILKVQQLKEWQAAGFKIVGMFEDRPRICRAVRELGITVFQMNHEEF